MSSNNLSVKFALLLLLAALIISGCSSSSPELVNLGRTKRQIAFYYEAGKYQAEVNKIIADAIVSFSKIDIQDSSAVVFDVDETALSNYEEIKDVDFGYVPSLWDEYILQAKAPANEEVKSLYNWLLQKKVHIIFLTGRNPEHYEATYKNLVSAGYTKFDTLIVRSKNTLDTPAGVFKSIERIVLSQIGYKIVGSVGDQPSDFQGEFPGTVRVKLPNYMYMVD